MTNCAKRFCSPISKLNWFHSRADDIISCAGYRIRPTEVEANLMEHPAVLEAVVVGMPDKAKGEVGKAYIVLNKTEQIFSFVCHTKKRTYIFSISPFKILRKDKFNSTLSTIVFREEKIMPRKSGITDEEIIKMYKSNVPYKEMELIHRAN